MQGECHCGAAGGAGGMMLPAPYYDDGQATIYHGDALAVLRELPDESVHCCVTSPPYYALSDYQVDGQMGLEETPAEFITKMVDVFREVRRVLRSDGTCWLNIGDSYASGGMSNPSAKSTLLGGKDRGASDYSIARAVPDGLKPKDLMMIPARLALALQDDGWYVRSDIIWHKTAPMPESVTDRPTSAHEHVFLLSKRANYFYDSEAVREPNSESSGGWQGRARRGLLKSHAQGFGGNGETSQFDRNGNGAEGRGGVAAQNPAGRNQRNVWTLGPDPSPEAHFATFPREIPRRAILAGTSEHGVCAACGAPWVRVVERVKTLSRNRQSGQYGATAYRPIESMRRGRWSETDQRHGPPAGVRPVPAMTGSPRPSCSIRSWAVDARQKSPRNSGGAWSESN